ncbi:MAG: hypothetical protein KDA80_22900, partial [Planctomycetaceae bacterium]|nr:hypothetical protein [Planctomycetaceae bacterium]
MLPNPLRPVLFLLVSGFPCFAVAEEATFSAEQLEFFEKKIRPVLVRECYECHSAEAKILRGGLLVDSRSGLMTGGDSGPSVVAGESESSLLLEALRYES